MLVQLSPGAVMRSILAVFALALSLALAPPPAEALEAEELRAEVEALLAEARAALAPVELESGAIAVAPEGQALRLTVPDLAFYDPADQRRIVVGTLSVLITQPSPGLYGFDDLRLAERMTVLDGSEEVGWIALDLERFSGVFSLALQEFLQLDLLAQSLEIRMPDEHLLVGAGRIAAWVATVPEHEGQVATGFQRGRQYASVTNLLIADDEATLEIAELVGEGAIDGFDLRLYETLLAVIDDLETAAAQGDDSRVDALRNAVAEAAAFASALSAGVRVKGIAAYDAAGARTFWLDSLRFAFALNTPRQAEFGSASLSFSGEGLAIDPASDPEVAPYIDILPRSWSIPLVVEHLPLDVLAASLADLAVASAGSPFQAEERLESVGNAALAALGTAGSYLIVRDLFVEAPLVRLDSKASLAFSPAVEWGVVGNWAVTLTGLDRVLAMAEGMTDPDTKRILSAVVLGMMGFGQAVALPDGRVGYRFSFFFAPDGTVQMNGYSFGDLMNNAIPQ
jgi:hypothetical protein